LEGRRIASEVGYRWVDHTAEVELEIEAPTEASVFEDALTALAELLDGGAAGELVTVDLSLAGSDRALLLADWLDELVFHAETERLIPCELARLELRETGLATSVRCRRGSPRPLVKGVTHHRLTFDSIDGGFRATVILDV
jgi:protein archease